MLEQRREKCDRWNDTGSRQRRSWRSTGLDCRPSRLRIVGGVHYSRNPQQSEDGLHDFLSRVSFVGVDEEPCKLFGKERGRLRAQGKLVPTSIS